MTHWGRFKQTRLVGAGKGLLLLSVAAAAVGSGLLSFGQASVVDIRFGHYAEAGLAEQDVFVAAGDLPDAPSAGDAPATRPQRPHTDPLTGRIISDPRWVSEVVRVGPAEALRPVYLAKMLYAANIVTLHDPFQLTSRSLGPVPKGDELGLSLAEWLAARGSGTYTSDGQTAELQLSFEKLVPHGTYRLWCARITLPPHYTTSERPCGAGDGSQNTVQADARGSATFHLRFKALPETNDENATVLQLNYIRAIVVPDGELGGYGLNEHVQLYATLPASLPTRQSAGGSMSNH